MWSHRQVTLSVVNFLGSRSWALSLSFPSLPLVFDSSFKTPSLDSQKLRRAPRGKCCRSWRDWGLKGGGPASWVGCGEVAEDTRRELGSVEGGPGDSAPHPRATPRVGLRERHFPRHLWWLWPSFLLWLVIAGVGIKGFVLQVSFMFWLLITAFDYRGVSTETVHFSNPWGLKQLPSYDRFKETVPF